MTQRENMQVAPEFRKKLLEIQAHLLMKGIRKSLTAITKTIATKINDEEINVEKDINDVLMKMDKRRRLF